MQKLSSHIKVCAISITKIGRNSGEKSALMNVNKDARVTQNAQPTCMACKELAINGKVLVKFTIYLCQVELMVT
jgi:hypothetical protein